MTNITNGTLEYSRTIQVAEYQPKAVKISLSFQVNEGEDPAAVLDQVGQLALVKANTFLGLTTPAVTKAAATKEVKAVAEKAQKAQAQTAPAKGAEVVDEMPADTAAALKEASAPNGTAKGGAEVVEEDFGAPAPVAPMSDDELLGHAKKKNAALGGQASVRIKELALKHYGKQEKPYSRLADMPQHLRHGFVKELENLA